MQYYWSDKDIKDKIKELQNLYNNTHDRDECRVIRTQIYAASHSSKLYGVHFRQPGMFEAFNDLKEYIHSEDFAWDTIDAFNDNTAKGFSLYTPSELVLTEDEIMQLTHDFYKSFPKEIYEAFLQNYQMRYDHIRFEKKRIRGLSGYAHTFPSLHENFALLCKNDTIHDVFNAIHENGHFIWSTLNKHYPILANNYIRELIPMAMELIASDFFSEQFKDHVIRERGANHALLIERARTWQKFMGLLVIEQEYYEEFKNTKDLLRGGKDLNLDRRELAKLLNLEAFPEMYILIAYIYAIELFELYKKDPEYASYVMQKIMLDKTEKPEDSIQMLENQGLNANEHSQEFHDRLIRSLNKLS